MLQRLIIYTQTTSVKQQKMNLVINFIDIDELPLICVIYKEKLYGGIPKDHRIAFNKIESN